MKKCSILILDFLSFLGLCLVTVFIILAVNYATTMRPLVLYIFPVASIICGTVLLLLTLFITKKAYHMFFSLIVLCIALAGVIDIVSMDAFRMSEWWPMFGVAAGLSLFFTRLSL